MKSKKIFLIISLLTTPCSFSSFMLPKAPGGPTNDSLSTDGVPDKPTQIISPKNVKSTAEHQLSTYTPSEQKNFTYELSEEQKNTFQKSFAQHEIHWDLNTITFQPNIQPTPCKASPCIFTSEIRTCSFNAYVMLPFIWKLFLDNTSLEAKEYQKHCTRLIHQALSTMLKEGKTLCNHCSNSSDLFSETSIKDNYIQHATKRIYSSSM